MSIFADETADALNPLFFSPLQPQVLSAAGNCTLWFPAAASDACDKPKCAPSQDYASYRSIRTCARKCQEVDSELEKHAIVICSTSSG